MIVLQVIGCALAGISLFNCLLSKGSGFHELAWVLGAATGAAIAAVGFGVVTL